MTIKKCGISSIGIHVPHLYLDVTELAKLRNVDPDKYRSGLGCKDIAICDKQENAVTLAHIAAKRALSRWHKDISEIGLLAVGTETAMDMSRPLSAWVSDLLHLEGNIRSYEVKHACYGGTLAVRQALEWIYSGANRGKSALVISADVAKYAQNDPGEVTGGAGAVALIIDDEARIARIDLESYPYSKPVFDFWRPVGEDFPSVDGHLSIDCYIRAVKSCFEQLIDGRDFKQYISEYEALCFHIPFPKMVKKAVTALCTDYGLSKNEIDRLYTHKVEPSMAWNIQMGNSYTASLWVALANALCGLEKDKKIIAFSYGSGCGAELLTCTSANDATKGEWAIDLETDFASRQAISAKEYALIRSKE